MENYSGLSSGVRIFTGSDDFKGWGAAEESEGGFDDMTNTGSNIERILDAGGFVVTSECGPPRGSDGSVIAWGNNYYSQLLVPPLPPGVTYIDIASCWSHALARTVASAPRSSCSGWAARPARRGDDGA